MKIINQLKIVIIIATIGLSSQAQAATYYVATTGNDGNAGTEAAPFRTIQKGADVAKAGDTVMVLPGTYRETGGGSLGNVANRNDGTATARIRFVSKERWGAKVISSGSEVLWRSMGDYVDIEGFDIDGTGKTGGPGVVLGGTHNRALHNHIHHFQPPCLGAVGITQAGYDTNIGSEVIGNFIHDNRPKDCVGRSGYGIYFGTMDGKVQNNIVFNNGNVGIHLWHIPTRAIVSHNLVFNNGGTGIVFGCGDAPFRPCNNITISNNIVMNHTLRGIREMGNNSGSRVFNNILYNNVIDAPVMKTGTASNNQLGVNPQLINFQTNGTGNYMPASGSPAIDAASANCPAGSGCIPPSDYLQGARPFGSAADIGPYEVGSTPGTVPPGIGSGSGGDEFLPPCI